MQVQTDKIGVAENENGADLVQPQADGEEKRVARKRLRAARRTTVMLTAHEATRGTSLGVMPRLTTRKVASIKGKHIGREKGLFRLIASTAAIRIFRTIGFATP